jgi:hypothetical protein
MPSLYAIAASLTLSLPLSLLGHASGVEAPGPLAAASVAGVSVPQSGPVCHSEAAADASHSRVNAPPAPAGPGNVSPLSAFYEAQVAHQVRIEQRVTVRISPYRQPNPNSLLARLPQRGLTTTFREREMSGCIPVSGIAGVQTGNGNRLLLFLRDQRIISLNLERACRARDFYSGFYIERSEDGQLCVDRDLLQSRSGAKCEVERMRQLVAVED